MQRLRSLLLLVACLAGLPAACATQGRPKPQTAPYRTVTPEPHRDTDAARVQNQQGVELLARGEADRAADAFTRALSFDVEYGPAHNNLGKVHFLKRDWYKAAWEFEYASKLMPEQAEPKNNLGLVLEQAGELDRAVDQFRAARSLNPAHPDYRANLARALVRRSDDTLEIRDLLRQIIEQDPRPNWVDWAREQSAILGPSAR